MLAYVVEFLGTFLFLSVIVATNAPFLAAFAFFIVSVLGGGISGGHFNPATSIMFWANGSLAAADMAGYIAAQVLGGLGALAVYKAMGM